MSARRRRRAPPPPPPGGLLDWGESEHWDYAGPKPCRYCKVPTQLRDSHGSHAHKTCAEDAIAQQIAEAADAYQNGTL